MSSLNISIPDSLYQSLQESNYFHSYRFRFIRIFFATFIL